jgi:hypothetical protein
MSKFQINELKNTTNKDGSKIITYQVYRKDKKEMTPQELKTIAEGISKKTQEKKGDFHIKAHSDELPQTVFIRGLRPDRWTTIKSFGKDIDVQDEDEYLNGRELHTTKFQRYYQAQISLKLLK